MNYGLIGKKLSHSFSKQIHQTLADFEYHLWELDETQFHDFMQHKDFDAINVTIPYKQKVIPYLSFIDENAKAIGAVNTIVNKNSRLYGYNTDFGGLKRLFLKNKFDLKNKNVLILGTGGTSLTAKAVCQNLGAGKIEFVSRNGKVNYENIYEKADKFEYIINTTPCGMFPNVDASPIDVSKFKALKGVADVIYNPLRTNLTLEASRHGVAYCNGLYMLSAQAILASEYFLNTKYSDDVFDEIYNSILKSKQNIVFIGMPGCGKSSFCSKLSNDYGLSSFDSDDVISQKCKMPPAEIIRDKGEIEFRKIEADVIEELSLLNGCVIATGGGAVLNPKNVLALKRNGIVIFIDRPVDEIVPTDDRPLSSSREALKKRYDERIDIYKSSADIIIDGSGTIDQVYKRILNELNT